MKRPAFTLIAIIIIKSSALAGATGLSPSMQECSDLLIQASLAMKTLDFTVTPEMQERLATKVNAAVQNGLKKNLINYQEQLGMSQIQSTIQTVLGEPLPSDVLNIIWTKLNNLDEVKLEQTMELLNYLRWSHLGEGNALKDFLMLFSKPEVTYSFFQEETAKIKLLRDQIPKPSSSFDLESGKLERTKVEELGVKLLSVALLFLQGQEIPLKFEHISNPVIEFLPDPAGKSWISRSVASFQRQEISLRLKDSFHYGETPRVELLYDPVSLLVKNCGGFQSGFSVYLGHEDILHVLDFAYPIALHEMGHFKAYLKSVFSQSDYWYSFFVSDPFNPSPLPGFSEQTGEREFLSLYGDNVVSDEVRQYSKNYKTAFQHWRRALTTGQGKESEAWHQNFQKYLNRSKIMNQAFEKLLTNARSQVISEIQVRLDSHSNHDLAFSLSETGSEAKSYTLYIVPPPTTANKWESLKKEAPEILQTYFEVMAERIKSANLDTDYYADLAVLFENDPTQADRLWSKTQIVYTSSGHDQVLSLYHHSVNENSNPSVLELRNWWTRKMLENSRHQAGIFID